MSSRPWSERYWPALIIAFVVGFGIPEAWTIYDGDPATRPLTDWSIAHGLGEAWVVLGLFVVFHFGIREIARRLRRR